VHQCEWKDNSKLQPRLKFHEVATKRRPVVLAVFVFVAVLFLSTASGTALAKLALSALISNYRWAVGIILLIAAVSVAAIGLWWITKWIYRETSAMLAQSQTLRHEKVRLESTIAKLTFKEREIIGSLLANNKRKFTNPGNGGFANTLVAKGIVVLAVRRGQAFLESEVPFEVPELAWKILLERKGEFPSAL
jgi:Super-infection exclusion protein B